MFLASYPYSLATSSIWVTAPDLLQFLSCFFDGLCGAVNGVIAIIAAQILRSSIKGVVRQAEQTSVNAEDISTGRRH
jgi:hypothetical protein